MRPLKKYCLDLPSGGQLIVEAGSKLEAVAELEKLGHMVGCGDLKVVGEEIKKRV